MIYISKKLLYVLILIYIHIIEVCESNAILFHHHNENDVYDDFDITTIYRITNMAVFNGSNDKFINNFEFNEMNSVVEIHSRTNAIGMPIQDDKNIHIMSTNIKEIINLRSFQNNSHMSTSYTSNDWRHNMVDLNGYYCNSNYGTDSSYRAINTGDVNTNCYNVFEYNFITCLDSYTDLYFIHPYQPVLCNLITFYWTPEKYQTCITMTYNTYFQNSVINSYFSIMMDVYNENNILISSTELKKKIDGVKTLKITNIDFKNNQEYKLSLKLNVTNRFEVERINQNFRFGLMRIAQCSNYGEEDVRIVSMNKFSKPKSFNILGNSIVRYSYKPSDPCLNGGYIYEKSSKCVCPPGFKGQFCETGCGVNSYGSDCKGVCSIRADKMCRGILMCTSYGCTCPAGLTGPLCNKDCTLGTYGANCSQTCSEHCLSYMCDQYTGTCLHGCSDGYVPPYCLEKYPYFINPPTLFLAKYDAIEIELNFQENNIQGEDKIMKPKYYQLYYKTLIENTFRSSEIKSISHTNNITIEVIGDLEPDTKYTVGVLLIADDGNYNEQDIVYGQYKTLCMRNVSLLSLDVEKLYGRYLCQEHFSPDDFIYMYDKKKKLKPKAVPFKFNSLVENQPSTSSEPKITDYNIQLMSGIQSINMTWSIKASNRLECNVTEYVLTLMSNQSQNQISDVQQILSSSDSGHFLDNLLPGFQYNIKLTPSTSNGTLPSSPIYSITTLMTRNNFQIKNISANNENGKIKLNWVLANSHQQYSRVDEPVTSIIRYKLKRILSCSMREVEQNWTSITIFNRTNYEIFDAVPNSQYIIQVLVDGNTNQQENMIYVLTPASNPKIEPLLDPEHPMYITNNSIFIQWKFDPKNCSKLNGFLSQFYVELKDKVDNILQIRETKNNYISFNELKSNTAYELKVFIKTHIGYNPEHFLLTNFTTKFGNLKPVEDLVVYKKSLKNRMVGFRWSYSQDTNLDGFIVSFIENPFINTKNVTIIPPQKCSAWPEYYCQTFYNLSPSNNYTFKIKPKSIDYPEGGTVSSISFNSIDGLPDSPMNIKTTEIGNTTISLQWDIPWIFNGVLKMFVVNVEEISSLDMDTCCVGIAPTEIPVYEELPTYNHTITGLQPGSTYSVGVLAVSKSLWYSAPSRLSVTTI